VSEYNRYWAPFDPWARAAREQRLPAGTVEVGDAMVARAEMRRLGFFNDYGLRYDLTQCVTGLTEHSERHLSCISVNRGETQARFGEHQATTLRALIPYVQRALELHRRLGSAEAMADDLAAAVDLLAHAVVLLTERGTVAFANRSAAAILGAGDGLRVEDGELCASTPSLTAALRASVSAAATIAMGDDLHTLPPVLRIPRPSGRRAYAFMLSPLPRLRAALDRQPHTVAVFISDPERVPAPLAATIRTLLHLTQAEADLVVHLCQGLTVDEATHSLGISLETGRTRLKTIFHKTDTHRQADLVRLVMASLAPLGD
jgi:DNA-binding CsgD family transcriptional regulator